MFRMRAAARHAATALKQALPAQRAPGHALRTAALCGGAAAAVAATVFVVQQTRGSSLLCEPKGGDVVTEAQAAAARAAASSGAPEPIVFYEPTASHLHRLPEPNSRALENASLDELAKLYDPTHKEQHSLAHTIFWGAPSPEHTLPALPLLFTSTDTDPFHRHMELLIRSLQNRICNNLLDVEAHGSDLPLGAAGAPATLPALEDGTPLGPRARELLLSQSDAPGKFRQSIVVDPTQTRGGIERVLSGGRVFAKAGVNISISKVEMPLVRFRDFAKDHPSLQRGVSPEDWANMDTNGTVPLWTASISLVLHPVNPHVPTVHANWRFFDLTVPNLARVPGEDGSVPSTRKHWWFGGGSDLTPTYVEDAEARHFHSSLRHTLDRFTHGGGESLYPRWKAQCDKYFFLPHRKESRGVGGVFFDDETGPRSKEQYEQILRALGEGFSATYFPIVMKKKSVPFTEADLEFQQLRRGRYVEYNLVYDRGTSYGLRMPNARVDAILMSLPPLARFQYKQPFDQNEKIKYTKEVLSNPKDW